MYVGDRHDVALRLCSFAVAVLPTRDWLNDLLLLRSAAISGKVRLAGSKGDGYCSYTIVVLATITLRTS